MFFLVSRAARKRTALALALALATVLVMLFFVCAVFVKAHAG